VINVLQLLLIRFFQQAELCNTKDRTAFFVFISQLEKKLVLIADKGIKECVPQDELHEIQVKFDAVSEAVHLLIHF